MRILFVADGHSPIARAWIGEVARRGHDVALVTTHPAAPLSAGVRMHEVLLGMSGALRRGSGAPASDAGAAGLRRRAATRLLGGRAGPLLRDLRWRLAALDVYRQSERCRRRIESFAPDLVHAMRITFEGALAALATPAKLPLVVSVWGNEFTLHARTGRTAARLIRQTLARADALTTDCARDARLARRDWSFDEGRPIALLPGAGGVDPTTFHPGASAPPARAALDIPEGAEVIINPRGLRSYVCNEAFYRALPAVLAARPGLWVLAPGTAESSQVREWTARAGIAERVIRMPVVCPSEMAELFRSAKVTVSPSLHDGTPNSLLEAMACGCVPVAGDIESLREWIRHGENGLLCDPRDPAAIAAAIVRALSDEPLRRRAQRTNEALIRERALRDGVMDRAEELYDELRRPGTAPSGIRVASWAVERNDRLLGGIGG